MNISQTNRIWYIVGLMMILSISTVYAADGTTTETLTDMIFNILWSLLNLLYLITLPVLVIAGKAMDNSMVYGEFINLDKPLYMLWNLCRTFANFAIGGVILRKIIKYIFTDWSWKSPDFLKKTIMSAVAIVLGINFSWFIIGALLDISTILTYSLWAMPLSILKETNSKDMPILSVSSYFDYQSEDEKKEKWPTKYVKPYTYYQWWSINIPQCTNGISDKNSNQTLYKWLVVWPEYVGQMTNKSSVDFTVQWDKYCAINSQTLANITALEKWKDENFKTTDGIAINTNNDKNELMKQVINHITTSTDGCNTELILKKTITNNTNTAVEKEIKIWSNKLQELQTSLIIGDGQINSFTFCWSSQYKTTNNAYSDNSWQSSFLQWWNNEPYSSQWGLTMNTLINKSKGMVWPFVTLYMSLLDFSNLSVQGTYDKTQETTFGGITEFLLKWAISVALFIPLVALAFVLIVRVVILRWIIAFIPLGIVLYGLKDDIKLWWGKLSAPKRMGTGEINAWSILWLIFAPVLPVFAISISIIILQTLQIAMKGPISDNNKTRDFLGIQSAPNPNDNTEICMDFRWLQTTCIKKGDAVGGGFTNFLPWLFVNIFAIGLMWMMVKVAISGSTITSNIGNKVMDLWASALWSIPLMNIWGVKVGASSLSKAPWKALTTAEYMMNDYGRKQDDAITKLLKWDEPPKEKGAFVIKDENSKKIQENMNKSIETNKDKSVPIKTHFAAWLKEVDEEAYKQYIAMPSADQTSEVIKFLSNSDELSTKIMKAIQEWYPSTQINSTTLNNFVEYLNKDSIIKAINKKNLDSTVKESIQNLWWEITYDKNPQKEITKINISIKK